MDEAWIQYVNWKKPDTEEQTLYGSICMRFLG